MKYTQIFVCIIARGQIARDRAMGAIFRRKYGLESILGGGGKKFPERPTCVGVDHGISNEW